MDTGSLRARKCEEGGAVLPEEPEPAPAFDALPQLARFGLDAEGEPLFEERRTDD